MREETGDGEWGMRTLEAGIRSPKMGEECPWRCFETFEPLEGRMLYVNLGKLGT
jgi:hypothetical protein